MTNHGFPECLREIATLLNKSEEGIPSPLSPIEFDSTVLHNVSRAVPQYKMDPELLKAQRKQLDEWNRIAALRGGETFRAFRSARRRCYD